MVAYSPTDPAIYVAGVVTYNFFRIHDPLMTLVESYRDEEDIKHFYYKSIVLFTHDGQPLLRDQCEMISCVRGALPSKSLSPIGLGRRE